MPLLQVTEATNGLPLSGPIRASRLARFANDAGQMNQVMILDERAAALVRVFCLLCLFFEITGRDSRI